MEYLSNFSLLRMLTPEEILSLTGNCNGNGFRPLTELVLEELAKTNSPMEFEEVVREKVAPKSEKQILRVKTPSEAPDDMVEEMYEDYNERVSEALRRQKEAQEMVNKSPLPFKQSDVKIEKEMDPEKIETSVFILAEQRRMKKNQQMLKGREVLGIYQKNAKLSIEQEKEANKDLTKSSNSGVLINKRRF